MEYPKIHSLYKREFTEVDPTTGKIKFLDKGKSGNPLILGEFSQPEFEAIKTWTIDEKVDGTNIRIILTHSMAGSEVVNSVEYHGKTDNAQLPTPLYRHLQTTFPLAKLERVFPDYKRVILFGEGYGPKIQQGGWYRKEVSFILFDVYCDGWWLNKVDVMKIADELEIDCCCPIANPYMATFTYKWTVDEIVDFIKKRPLSHIALEDRPMEGIVARSSPLMLFRNHPLISENPVVHATHNEPIMFKLKCRDFK